VNCFICFGKFNASFILLLLGFLLTGCVHKPIINPGQSSAKIEFEGYLRAELNLAGNVNCGSFLGLSTSNRALKPILYYNIDTAIKSGNPQVAIPASDNQIFLIKQYIPQAEGTLQYFWFKFPIVANKHYHIDVDRVVTKKGIILDDYVWTLMVLDENKQVVPYEMVPSPNQDPQCKKST